MLGAECPTGETLAAFATGGLRRDRMETVARHVETCDGCAARLAEWDGTPLLAPAPDAAPHDLLPGPLRAELLGVFARPAGEPAAGPRALGRFELTERLGTGSFGDVYRARDPELGRDVAVKVLRAGGAAGSEEVERFLREARSAAHLRHPGIVAVHEAGRAADGTPYLVEELVEGVTLAALVRAGHLDPARAAALAADIADALQYAHDRGVVHRDVTPSNVVVGPDGRPHLMDFGLAKREADEPPVTADGQVLGTPAYMAPEQARGDSRHVDARGDVYSLGVVLYELLTGDRPFRGNRRMLLLQVLEDDPRPPRRLNDRVPRDLETVCLKAMAKTPGRRYPSAADLAADLRRFLRGESVRARRAGPAERAWRWCRRNPVPAGLLLAVTAGSAVGVWHLSRLSDRLVRAAALESAAQESQVLEEVNSFYSTAVVDRVRPEGVPVTHDYAARPGAIPLPATLTIELGQQIGARDRAGVRVRLYSDHPFRTRPDGGPRDEFERAALARLRDRPEEPVARFEEFGGRPVLRYATARRMGATCVACHNAHPDSTRRDWKEGDVRGVLEIIRPLENDAARVRAGLRDTAVLMAGAFVGLLGLTVATLVYGRHAGRQPAS